MTTKVFVISLNCDNAAYEGESCAESVAENLREVADKILQGSESGHVQDYNGNIVGKYFFAKA